MTDGDGGLARFTREGIHQHVAQRETMLRVRAIVDGRSGVAATDHLEDEGVARCVDRALELARLAPRDPEFAGFARSERAVAPEGSFATTTAQTTPEERTALVERLFAAGAEDGLWPAGYVSTSRQGVTIANSAGTTPCFDGTNAAINVKQIGAESSGFAERHAVDLRALDATAIGMRAARKAVAGLPPIDVEPGEWTVILEPPAFGELVAYLTEDFSARAYDDGSSFVAEALGQRYVGENVTILDDYAHALAPGRPFDDDGVPTQRLALIRDGVIENIVTDASWAARLGRPNTGHATMSRAWGPMPRHVVVLGGTKSTGELIAGVTRGLLVTRCWYIRTVDQRRTIVTGMTRDGTFLIENGAVTRAVRNLRFNQSIVEALRRSEFSRELARNAGYSYSLVAPTARIDGFRFTSTTSY